MILLGLWLGAMGVADVVAGVSGVPGRGARSVAGVTAATLVAAVGAWALGSGAVATVALAAVVAASAGAWIFVRVGTDPRRAAVGLAAFAAATLAVLAATRWWPPASGELFGRWLDASPFPVLVRTGVDQMVLLAGVIVWLFATGNALVRLVLLSVGSDPKAGETRLKGGRIIGPMERWLIFGFALAGSLPAAALVVTAKSLVRFPELGRETTKVHEVTEYFLVGSLSSWLLALLPVTLFP